MNTKKINWDVGSKSIIYIFFFIFMLYVSLTPTAPTGESDDYMLSTISLENRFSLRMTETDVEQARTDFPEHYQYIKSSWDSGMTHYFTIEEGEVYPWYMGTYSIACIPMKKLLDFMGLNQSYAFVITNVICYVIALLFVYFKLQTTRKNVFFTILLLVCSPTIFYFIWSSAEIFIFSLVVISLVYFCNGNHKLAGLFVSIAGTLNPTIMAYGAIIILDYFTKMYIESRTKGEKNIFNIVRSNIKDIILLIICFIPSLTTFIFNYITFGIFNLQNILGFARYDYVFQRFLTYLFDLNLGFLPYFTISFLLFFIMVIYGIYKKDRLSIMFPIAFLLTVLAYGVTWHINCGMSGIARYNAWSFPIFIFYLTTQASNLIERRSIKILFYSLLVCSCILSTSVVINLKKSDKEMHHTIFTPIATYVLDNYPSLYNPYKYTFISRTKHLDGAYIDDLDKPVIYTDSNGNIRKILTSSKFADNISDYVYGDEKDMKKLKEKINKRENDKGNYYITIEKNIYLRIIVDAPKEFVATSNQNISEFTSGVYYNETNFHWISPQAKIILKSDKITKEGINIILNYPLAIIPFSDEALKVDIYVNDKLVETIPLISLQKYNIFLDKNRYEEADFDFYEVEFIINGAYNPKKLGLSPDSRDLTLQLEYIG
jgi:hypothetical protein